MSTTTNLDWLYHLLGYSLAAAGFLLLLWSLFRDRSRGRRRCPRCWYDMAGIPGLTCPECGRQFASERKLQRTRRHLRQAALAILVILGGFVVGSVPRVRNKSWPAWIPSAVLMVIARAEPPRSAGATRLTDEMWSRVHARTPAAWQSRFFLKRILKPISGPDQDARVRDALAPYLAIDDGRAVLVSLDRQASYPWNYLDYGVDFTYEIRADGIPIATGSGSCSWPTRFTRAQTEDPVFWQTRELDQAVLHAGTVTITVRGDRVAAALDFAAYSSGRRAACWAGEFTMPLKLEPLPTRPKESVEAPVPAPRLNPPGISRPRNLSK